MIWLRKTHPGKPFITSPYLLDMKLPELQEEQAIETNSAGFNSLFFLQFWQLHV